MIQIQDVKEAKSLKLILEKIDLDPNHTVNIILKCEPKFDLSPSQSLNEIKNTVNEIKNEID